jgi:hypothetical protein
VPKRRLSFRHYEEEDATAVYVREKKTTSGSYHQVVESVRVEGRPRQRVVLHLGEYATLKEARTGMKRELNRLRKAAERFDGPHPSAYAGKEAARIEARIAKLSGKLSKVEGLLGAS